MKTFLVGRGRISGTYADGFHHVREDGKMYSVIDNGGRDFYRGELELVLSDIKRHREKLLEELKELEEAERVLSEGSHDRSVHP